MARGENPMDVISIQTTLDHDPNVAFGHASAGKDLAMAWDGGIAADNEVIAGKFMSLNKKKEASVLASGKPILLRKSSATIAVGDKVVGAGNGKVKTGTAANGRGRVQRVLETGDNGRILVWMP